MRHKPPASRALSAVIALSVVSGAPASEAAAAIARTSIPASLPPAAVRPVIAALPLSVSATAGLPSLNLPVFSPLSSVPLPAGPAAVPSISVSPGAAVIRRPASAQAHLSLIRATGAIATQPAQPGAAPKAELVELSRVSTDKKGGIAAAFGAIFDGRRPLDGASPVKAGENAADRAADLLKGDDKAELFLTGFYWGGLELDALAKAPVNLGAPEQAWLDAYKALVRYGLRPKATSESDAAKLRAALAVPAMSGVLASVGTTLRELEIPVMDTKAIDDDNDIPQEVLKRAVTLGLHRLKFPKEFGGLGLRQREYVQVLETVVPISAALVAQLGAQNTIGTAPLTMFGTRAQQEKYLPRLSNGEGLVSFGLTEPLAGTDLDRLGTTAVLQDGRWRLSGQKIFITGIMDAQVAFARHQNTLIRAFEAQADILSLAMVETELSTDRDMDPTRRFVLEKAVAVLRWQVRRSLSDMTPWGHPVENAQAAVGRRLMSQALEDRGDRPDRVRQHLDFLERTADEFHARLRAEAGHE